MCKEELVTELERDCVGERIYVCMRGEAFGVPLI